MVSLKEIKEHLILNGTLTQEDVNEIEQIAKKKYAEHISYSERLGENSYFKTILNKKLAISKVITNTMTSKGLSVEQLESSIEDKYNKKVDVLDITSGKEYSIDDLLYVYAILEIDFI